MDEALLLIQTNSIQQQFKRGGVAKSKNQQRDKLEIMILDNGNRIHAFAKYIKNTLLTTETKFSKSSLKNKTDLELHETATGLYSRITTNLDELDSYGLTDLSQKEFKNCFDLFNEAIPSIKQTMVNHKESTIQINKGFKDADIAIDNLDTLVEILRFSNPVFYFDYKSTRMIIDTASITLAVKGKIVDTDNNTVKGVDITFIDKNNNNVVVLNKKTAAKGGFTVKSLAEGEYRLLIGKTGYISQTLDIVVTNRETTFLNISISKK